MNFFLRQSITGLLRHAADTLPPTRDDGNEIAEHLDRMLSIKWLDRAFSLFQQAAFLSGDPVFVTGAVWTVQAMNEVSRYQRQAGVLVDDETAAPSSRSSEGTSSSRSSDPSPFDSEVESAEIRDEAAREAGRGVAELFDRIRRGASLEEALALFPSLGDESESS